MQLLSELCKPEVMYVFQLLFFLSDLAWSYISPVSCTFIFSSSLPLLSIFIYWYFKQVFPAWVYWILQTCESLSYPKNKKQTDPIMSQSTSPSLYHTLFSPLLSSLLKKSLYSLPPLTFSASFLKPQWSSFYWPCKLFP